MKKLLTFVLVIFCASYALCAGTDLREALRLIEEDKSQEAIVLLNKILKENPDSRDAHIAMGVINMQNNDYANAKNNFYKALSQKQESVVANYMLAMIYEKETNSKMALVYWNNVLKYAKKDNLKQLAQKHMTNLSGRDN